MLVKLSAYQYNGIDIRITMIMFDEISSLVIDLRYAILLIWSVKYYSSIAVFGHNYVARVEGDFTIGALFPVHESPAEGLTTCGSILEQYGMQRVEVALWTIKKLNK